MEYKLTWTFGLSGPDSIELNDGATIKELKEKLDGSFFITINGLNRPDEYLLCAGDDINIMPIVEGG